MVLKLVFDILFSDPRPPSWGEEVEYQYHYHRILDNKALMIDRALDGHHDGSGPWEISLPPANIYDYEHVYKVSAILENMPFTWGQYGFRNVYDLTDYDDPGHARVILEGYGMGRHLHYRPALAHDDDSAYAEFLENNVFGRRNHIVMLALTPFLTPYAYVANNEIHVRFRDSLYRWAYFVSRPTADHYAFININYADINKPTTIELRHNEAHPFEAYAFIILFHHLTTRDVKFSVRVMGDVMDDATIKVDGYTFTIYRWNHLTIPLDTFRHVVNKIAKAIDDRKLKKHVYDVYQNVVQEKRIFENGDVAEFYPSKTYETVSKKINGIIEDAYNNNISIYADVNEVKISDLEGVVLYAKKVEIRAGTQTLRLKVDKKVRLGAGVYLAPSASDKSGKMIKIL